MSTPGILALQGCVEPHIEMLKSIGVSCVKVRTQEDLNRVDRLILPGGESTTMLRILKREGLFELLKEFGRTHPMWGVCAGAILMAKEVKNPEQPSLQLVNALAMRNFYGSQRESFSTKISVGGERSFDVDFIRAPLLSPLSDSVRVNAYHEKETVFLLEGNKMLTSFHSELREDPWFHRFFLSL